MTVTSTDGRVQFAGVYQPTLLLADSFGNLYMGPDDNLEVPYDNMNLSSFLAYFLVDVGNGLGKPGPGVITDVVMNIEGSITTSILGVQSSAAQSQAGWYTLDGRKLNSHPTVKGLYIHNGRKVVVSKN